MSEGAQVNIGGIREAITAARNAVATPPVELQPLAVAAAPETPVPATAVAAPVEQPVTLSEPSTQTDHPAQLDEDFQLDLNSNPLDELPVEDAPAEPKISRRQWDTEFQEFIKTNPRGQRIWDNHVEMAKLSASPEEGGIGFKPEVDQVKQWHRTHSIMDEMVMDFTAGDPNAASKFVNYWFGRDAEGAAMEGATQIAEALPAVLAKENPEAYRKIGTHYGREMIDHLSALASVPGRTKEDIDRLQDAANLLSHVTGIRPLNGNAPIAAEPANDELAAAHAEIQRLRSGQTQQTQGSVRSTFERSLDRVLSADADAALGSLKQSSDPIMYDALKAKMITDMRRAALANPAIRTELSNTLKRFVRAGSIGDMGGAVRLWRQGYRDNLPQIRGQYLKAAGFSLTRPADDARAVMQQAQLKTAPSAGTAPMQSTPIQPRQANESMQDFVRRTLNQRRAG